MKLKEIADRINGTVTGSADLEIFGVSTIEEAGPTDLTFLSNPKYTKFLNRTAAAAIIISEGVALPAGKAGIIAEDPYLAFAEALAVFHPPVRPAAGLHPHASVASDAVIGAGASIGAFAVVEGGAILGDDVVIGPHSIVCSGAKVGDGSRLFSHCVVREECRIGNRVVLHDGTVIGSDGFGYAKRKDQSWLKIPQSGIVVVEDDVEIGAGCTIDRATIGETRIGRGVKIDNLTHIGHGCVIGSDSMLCAQVGLAGSTKVGRQVILLGQVGAAGHLTIGDRVIAIAQSGIPSSVEPDQVISGSPAISKLNWLKSSAIYAQLPRLQQELRKLRKQVDELLTGSQDARR